MAKQAKVRRKVFRVLNISTGHISAKDGQFLLDAGDNNGQHADMLQAASCAVAAYDRGQGHFVDIRAPNELKETFSATFCKLCRKLRDEGFDFLRLDCDGPIYADLPQFEW